MSELVGALSRNAGILPACGQDARVPIRSPKFWHSRGYLPHCDVPGLFQFVTFRLADSLPINALEGLNQDSDNQHSRIEELLDAGYGDCWLRRPEIADIVENTLLHFDGQRYLLLAWCVMPNHVHVLIQTRESWPLSNILHGWKSFTANAINRQLGRNGAVWMADYFDRYIRDDLHLVAVIEYIHGNPVKAGLVGDECVWLHSSVNRSAGILPACGQDARAPASVSNPCSMEIQL